MFNQSEIETANKTSRANGAVGANAIVPKFVLKHLELFFDKKYTTILDFGAGKQAMHTKMFQADGWACTAYEFGNNVDIRYHNELALKQQYDIVFASNVLNVQGSADMARQTIEQLANVMEQGVSKAFLNYPASPRKSDLTTLEMKLLLLEQFSEVIQVGGGKNASLWMCIK